jgi:hypothetical protein
LEESGVGQRCSSKVQDREVLVLHTRRLDEVEEGERDEEMREGAEEEKVGGRPAHLGFSAASSFHLLNHERAFRPKLSKRRFSIK